MPKITFWRLTMHRLIHKMISIVLVAGFVSASLQIPKAQAGEVVIPLMPKPGTMVNLSPAFDPAHLQGLVIHPDNALQFDFLINKGDGNLSDAQKRREYSKLIKYFLASLTVPDADQWVNLSPYEHNRIIKDNFGQTEMGRDLLAQDYLLKQITSSLMYPESGMGMEFWNQVYEKAHKELGNVNIPVNTFNKVWIVPSEAVIHENGNTAFIVKSHLKVMLEEDYVSLEKHTATNTPKNQTHALSSKAIKDIILPVLEKEVNEGKNFAQLRQVFSGMILATWYKQALKESLLGKVYADKAKTQGVNQDPKNNEAIYQQYITAFKKGVFNYIKDPDPTDAVSGAKLPRKYFAGGVGAHDGSLINRAMVAPFVLRQDFAMAGPERLEAVAADMQPRNSDAAMNASQDFVNDLNMALAEIANAEGKVTAAFSEDQTRITFSAGLTTRQAQMVSSKITEFLYKQQDLTVKLILKNIQGMDRVVGLFLNPRQGIGDAAMKVDLYGLKSIEDSKLLDRLSSLELVVEKETIQTVTVGQGEKERVYRSLTVYPAAVSDEGWGFESLEALRRRSAVEESTRRALAEGKRITTRLVEAFIQGNKELKLREDSSRGDYNILWESESDDARVKVALQEWIKKARLNVIAASRKALASLEKKVLADDAMAVALDITAAQLRASGLPAENIDKIMKIKRNSVFRSIAKEHAIAIVAVETAQGKGYSVSYEFNGRKFSFNVFINGDWSWWLQNKKGRDVELAVWKSGDKKFFYRLELNEKSLSQVNDFGNDPFDHFMGPAGIYLKHVINGRGVPILNTHWGEEYQITNDDLGSPAMMADDPDATRKNGELRNVQHDLDRIIARISGLQVQINERIRILMPDPAPEIPMAPKDPSGLIPQWQAEKTALTGQIKPLVERILALGGVLSKNTREMVDFLVSIHDIPAIEGFPVKSDDTAMAGNDKAAVVKTLDQLGGIDMNAANMDMVIKRDGKGVPLPLAQQDMAHLGSIEGFVPRIIEIRPAMSLPMFSQAN